MRKALLMAAASVAILLAGFAFPHRNSVRADVPGAQASAQNTETAKLLEGFAAIEPIDTHTHAFHNDPAFAAMLTRLHLHLLDIIVADDHNIFRSLVTERASARAFIAGTDGHAILCTTFDPFSFEKPGFAGRAIQQINDDFSRGAVAVKIWKNIGMEIKKTDGTYVMPDDPIFEPIYQDIAAHHKTLIAHLAEPSSCWEPPNPQSPDYSYYKENP
ncbi:MAG: amidohydrolase family protein, partial [Candidatus Acidiferrales bacterium]